MSINGLTRAEYFRLRDRYLPEHRKVVFVLESPPKSGLYFYNPEGSISEPLFRAMMKDVLEIRPSTKSEGLSKFAAHGYLLIDATYTPVNHDHLTSRQRNELVMDNFPLLVEDLRKHTEPDTGVVLVKANICEILESPLTSSGFKVLNQGKTIPFPSTGQQIKFRNAVRPILGL